jgi:hypothetical protein
MIGQYWSIQGLIGSLKSLIDKSQNSPLLQAVTFFAAGLALSHGPVVH